MCVCVCMCSHACVRVVVPVRAFEYGTVAMCLELQPFVCVRSIRCYNKMLYNLDVFK